MSTTSRLRKLESVHLPEAVLLVEDKETERALYKEWLEGAKYVVIDVSTKALALMHLDRLDLSFVVLDLRLPNGHGREVVEALVAKRDDVPVVVVTGLPDPPILGFPVTCTMKKPIARGMFLNAVNSAAETARHFRTIRRATRILHERCKQESPPIEGMKGGTE